MQKKIFMAVARQIDKIKLGSQKETVTKEIILLYYLQNNWKKIKKRLIIETFFSFL